MNWWRFFRRAQTDAEQRQELESYLEITAEEYIARGMSHDAAHAAARRKLGNSTIVREEVYRMSTVVFLDSVTRSVRHTLRSMRRNPAFAVTAIITLALGIGANTAIFTVVNAVLIKPLPYPDSDRLVSLAHSSTLGSAPFLYFIEREESRTFEGVGAYNAGTVSVTGRGDPEQVQSLVVTSEILPVLRVQPLLGRYFSKIDDLTGSPNTVVLTHAYWQRLGAEPTAIGQTLTINGQPSTIIGVMPETFRFLDRKVDVMIPFRIDRTQVRAGNFFLVSIARLKPGATLEQAAADVKRMIPIAIDSFPPYPESTREQTQRMPLTPNLKPLKASLVGDAGTTLWVLLGTIGMVLLIACANVANLILVRIESRQQELSIRAALGAGWSRIAGELLLESAVLSALAGLVGVGFAYSGLRALLAVAPPDLPRLAEISIDSTVLWFALGLSGFSALLFSSIPMIRYATPHLGPTLRSGGRAASASKAQLRARGVLVVAQVALALVLLVCSGLMIRTFQEINRVHPGFSGADEIQTAQITIPYSPVPDPAMAARRQREILDRISAVPGVTKVAFTSRMPMGGGFSMTDLLFPEGKTYAGNERPIPRHFRFISPDYFETLHVPLLAGRDLTWTDINEKRPVVLISENLARFEWGGVSQALGKRLRGSSAADQWREIVGIVGDVHDNTLTEAAAEFVYIPVLADRLYNNPTYVWRSVTFTIRSPRTGTPGFLDEIRRAVWSADPNLPLVNIRTLGDALAESMARTSFTLLMLAIAGGMALLLGVVGIYGVLAYVVSQRAREVGIRLALGARPAEVQRMFVRYGLTLTGIGVALGLAAAALLSRLLSSLLFGVKPLDPLTYGLTAMILLGAALAASYIPARRAAAVDPIETLRGE